MPRVYYTDIEMYACMYVLYIEKQHQEKRLNLFMFSQIGDKSVHTFQNRISYLHLIFPFPDKYFAMFGISLSK